MLTSCRSPAEQIFRRKLDPFKEKVAKLRTRRTDAGSECGQLSGFIAKKLCRTFADKFYVTLPRELREMVYDYVWDLAMIGLTFHDVTLYGNSSDDSDEFSPSLQDSHQQRKGTKAVPWAIPCTQDTCRCFGWWELPCWAHHECVGMDVATEVVKAYYRNTRSLSVEPDHLEDLTNLLYRDHFHLGVKPLDHIRRLEIPLGQDVLIGRGEKTSYNLQSMESLETFQYHFEVLLDVRVKKGFQLTILLTWHSFYIYYMPALERSRAVVNKLLMEDAKVTVRAWETRGFEEYDLSD